MPSRSTPRRFLIDTDTASDDAVALIMALRHPGVKVVAITVVSGNVPLRRGARNALYTAQLCGSGVPVYAGADRPLMREAAHAEWFHGRDGLGDQNYPPPRRKPRKGHAVDAIVEHVLANPGIEIVTLGPLTNLALALAHAPQIVRHVKRCVVMGGAACCEGNVTPAAEYNIWCDPEAAAVVFGSGLRIEMVGWELCRGKANLNRDDIARVRRIGTRLSDFAIDANRRAMVANRIQTGEVGIPLPDPVAMSVALNPSICTHRSRHLVKIETQSELTRGMTVVDRLNVAVDVRNKTSWGNARRITVCWRIDVPRWKALLFRALR